PANASRPFGERLVAGDCVTGRAGAAGGHVDRVLARRQQATPRSSGEGSIPLITLPFQLATTLSALASRAAGCRVATSCSGVNRSSQREGDTVCHFRK